MSGSTLDYTESICADCEHAIIIFTGSEMNPYAPGLCAVHPLGVDPVTGERDYESCDSVNKGGRCHDFAKIPWWKFWRRSWKSIGHDGA